MNRLISSWKLPARLLALACSLLAAAPPLAGGASGGAAGGAATGTPPVALPQLQTAAPTGRIVLQYTPEATGDDRARVAALAGAAPHPRVAPSLLQRAAARDRGPLPALADLARYAVVDPGVADRDALVRLAARLAADPAVDLAFLEPRAVPAALGFDAFTGRGPAPGALPAAAVTDTTPDFSLQQGYLDLAPDGIGARAVRPIPGGRGAGVAVVDVEGAWLWAHEDLPEPFLDLGLHSEELSWRNHGTAVVGQIRGIDNELGVEGIVPDADVGGSSIFGQGFPQALLAAAEHLQPGDLVLIELHAPGPESNDSGSQYGYVPMEFWQDNFDAIRALTDLGLIVVEAAGNGQQDLDDPVYLGLFDREQRDSGAIMVGATDGSALWPAWFTNHGSRVDLSGWGEDVVTCGYGDLQGGAETAWYTARFAGTSSASPIVTGAVAALQGMVAAQTGLSLDAGLARTILRQTGTPAQGDQQVGPRPDLVAAWGLVQQQGVGVITGTVTDADTGLPVAGATVALVGGQSQVTTDAAGGYRLGVLPGTHELRTWSYFHADHVEAVTAGAGETVRDLVLEPLPLATIGGVVLSAAGDPVAGAEVLVLGEPVPAAQSGADGTFVLPPVPLGRPHLLQAGGVPGLGGTTLTVDHPAGDLTVSLTLPTTDHGFETGTEGFYASGDLWQRGRPDATGLGPGTAFDGDWCWGVGLDGGGYPDDAEGRLLGPILLGGDLHGDRLYLSFHYWSGTEVGFDGVQVGVSDGVTTELVTPLGGYTDLVLGGLDHQPGWSGYTGGWRTAVFDLTGQLDAPLWQVVWTFGSDGSVNDAGFLIDGVTLDAVDVVVAAPDAGVPDAGATLAAWPNPFNPRVNLAWERPRSGPLDLAVYDLRGRLIRQLLAGETVPARGHVVWDGADGRGRPAPSGVYLVRLGDPGAPRAVQRITLAR